MSVVTYPQSAMVELYGDMVDWAPVPQDALVLIQDTNFQADLTRINNQEFVQNLTEFVKGRLMLKDVAIRGVANARKVRQKFGSKAIGRRWNRLLTRAISSLTNLII